MLGTVKDSLHIFSLLILPPQLPYEADDTTVFSTTGCMKKQRYRQVKLPAKVR